MAQPERHEHLQRLDWILETFRTHELSDFGEKVLLHGFKELLSQIEFSPTNRVYYPEYYDQYERHYERIYRVGTYCNYD